MKLKRAPELLTFLSVTFADSDPESDRENARAFASNAPAERRRQVVAQARALLAGPELPLDELGSEANRWFADAAEAREWLSGIADILGEDEETEPAAVIVKDSNGALLSEGDSVLVIKDLKVKGGSSDLKRGTLIKKIHLIDDSEAIECRVDGSTLVLKTCFLRKA
jgi:protein PhnA